MALELLSDAPRLSLRDAATDLYSPENLTAQRGREIDASTQFGRGWTSAGLGEDANALMSKSLAARRAGDEQGGAVYEQQARDLLAQSQQWAPTVQNMTDVTGLRSGLDWAGGAMGNIRSSVKPALGGLAGTVIGGVGGALVGGLPGAVTGARYGAGIGSGLLGGMTEYDEAVSNAMMDPSIRSTRSYDDIHNAALVKGGINAGLESLVPMGMAKSVAGVASKAAVKKAAEEGLLKTVGKEVGKNMLEEGATEGVQSLVGQGAENWLKRKDITDFDYKQALNEAAAGAIAGGGMGGVTGTADYLHGKMGNGVEAVKDYAAKPLQDKIADAGTTLANILPNKAVAEEKARGDELEERLAALKRGENRNFATLPQGEKVDPADAAKTATQLANADRKAMAHAETIINSQGKEYSQRERAAAAAYKAHRDFGQFDRDLQDAADMDALDGLSKEIEDRSPKSSLKGMTEEGNVAADLTDLWLSDHGHKYKAFARQKDTPAAKDAAMMLMAWVNSGYGAAHSEDGKQTWVPTKLLDNFGEDAHDIVSTMSDLATRQGTLKDSSQTKRVLKEIGEYVDEQTGEHTFVKKMLVPLEQKSQTDEKASLLSARLRQTKGKLSATEKALFSKYIGEHNVDALIKRFTPKVKESGTKGVWAGMGEDNSTVTVSSEDHGSDAITENDGDFNSGVSEFARPEEKMDVKHQSKTNQFFNVADENHLNQLMEHKADPKYADHEEIGVHDFLRATTSGADRTFAEGELLAKYTPKGERIPTSKEGRAQALKKINHQHRTLVKRSFPDASQHIRPEQVAGFKVSDTSYDASTKKATKNDTAQNGRVFIEMKDGSHFLASSAQLIRAVGKNNTKDQAIAGESAELVGTPEAAQKFHDGLSQLMVALKDSGKELTGRIGFKLHASATQPTWVSGAARLPRTFNYLSAEGYSVANEREQAPYVSRSRTEGTELTLADLSGMTRNEINKMISDTVESLAGVSKAMEFALSSEAGAVNRLAAQLKHEKKSKSGSVKTTVAKLSAARNKLDLAKQTNTKYQGLLDAKEALNNKLTALKEELDSRVEVTTNGKQRVPGEKRKQAERDETPPALTNMHDRTDINPDVKRGEYDGSTTYVDADGRVRQGEQTRRAIGEGKPLEGKQMPSGIKGEMEEMSENSVKAADAKPRILDSRGNEVVAEPTDSKGFHKDGVQHELNRAEQNHAYKIQQLEQRGKWKEAAALRAAGPQLDVPMYQQPVNAEQVAKAKEAALKTVSKYPFEGTAIQLNVFKNTVARLGKPFLKWVSGINGVEVTTGTKVGAFMRTSDMVVRLSKGLLNSQDHVLQNRMLAHEVAHANDYNAETGEFRSSSAPELEIKVDGDKRVPVGAVMKEVFTYLANNPSTKLTSWLNRDHSQIGKLLEGTTRNEAVAREVHARLAEVYARLAEVYFHSPEAMKRILPNAFAYMEKENERVHSSGATNAGSNEKSRASVQENSRNVGASESTGGRSNSALSETAAEGGNGRASVGGERRQSGDVATTSHGLDSAKKPSNAAPATQEQQDAAVAQIRKLVGEKVKVLFVPKLRGEGMWTPRPNEVMNLIKLALNGDIMGAAFHESFHEIMDILRKNGGDKAVAILERAAMNPLMQNRLRQALEGHPAAQKQLAKPEEAAAFMFQMWMADPTGFKIGPETKGVFQKIKDMLRAVAGVFSEAVRAANVERKKANMEALKVEDMLRAFAGGTLANNDTRAAVVEALNKDVAKHEAAVENVGSAMQTLINSAGKLVISAEAMMDATGNKYMADIARMFHQKAGTAMLKVGRAVGGYSDGVRQQTSYWMNKFENIMLEADKGDVELARQHLSKETNSSDPKVQKVVEALRGYMNEMKKYIADKQVMRFNPDKEDPSTGMKGVWEKIDFRKDYWPQVVDMKYLGDHMNEFKQDLLDNHRLILEGIAKQANEEIKNGDFAGDNTASERQLATKPSERKEVTAEMVAEAIATRLLNSQGSVDLDEDSSSLGITPMARAVNRRSLDWLNKDVFDKYMSTDVPSIVSTYTHSVVKRAEYQSRFGNGGEKIKELADKAVLHELGGEELIALAEKRLPAHIAAWRKAKGKANGIEKEPFPTLRSVGQKMHKVEVGEEKHMESLKKAVGKLEQGMKAVQALEGTLGNDISAGQRAIGSWLVTYQNFRLLSTMLFMSFQDVMGLVREGGEMADAWKAFTTGISEIKNTWTNTKSASQMMERAEMWGAVDAGSFAEAVAQAHGSIYMTGKAKTLSDKFFKYTGAEGWNRGVRGVAASVGERIILEWKKEGIDPKDKATKARVERLFGEGFDVANIKLDDKGQLDITDVANQAAIQRWMLDAVPAPTAAHRPIWGSDPHFQAFMHLKNYTYTFHRVVLKGAVDQARLGNYRPIAVMALGYMPIAIAAGAMKEMLIPGDEPPWMKGGLSDYIGYGFSRAGVLGVPQMYSESLFNPTQLLDHPSKAFDNFDPAGLFGPTADQMQNILSIPFMEDHGVIGEGLGSLPGGNLLKRLERIGTASKS